MKIIERIQPYYNRIDKEIEPYLDFLKQVISQLESEFFYEEKAFDERVVDKPYELKQIITKYGSKDKGFEIIQEEEYEQVAYGIAVDKVLVQAYGLSSNHKIMIISAREWYDTPYLELQITGSEQSVKKIQQLFLDEFENQLFNQEKLKKETTILKTFIKRGAWYPLEMRAKTILKEFPDEPFALFALAIARAAQGDLDSGESILQQVLLMHPEYPDADYNLGVIYLKKEEYTDAIYALKKALNLEPKNHPVYWMLGQVYESLGEIPEALDAYHEAVQTSPNPMGYGFIGLDFTQKAKEAIKRLRLDGKTFEG